MCNLVVCGADPPTPLKKLCMDPTLRPQYYQPFKMQTPEYHHHIIRRYFLMHYVTWYIPLRYIAMWDMHWSNDLAHFSEVSRYRYWCAVGLIQFSGLTWLDNQQHWFELSRPNHMHSTEPLPGYGKTFCLYITLKRTDSEVYRRRRRGREGGNFSLGYMCQDRVITYKNRTTWHASKCIRR